MWFAQKKFRKPPVGRSQGPWWLLFNLPADPPSPLTLSLGGVVPSLFPGLSLVLTSVRACSCPWCTQTPMNLKDDGEDRRVGCEGLGSTASPSFPEGPCLFPSAQQVARPFTLT